MKAFFPHFSCFCTRGHSRRHSEQSGDVDGIGADELLTYLTSYKEKLL